MKNYIAGKANAVDVIVALQAGSTKAKTKVHELSAFDKKLGIAQNDLLAARGQLNDGKSTSNDDGHKDAQALVDVKVLKVKLRLAESKSADSRQEISTLQQKYASLEQELLEAKDESLKIRAKLEKQHEVDVQEMIKRHEEELQSNAYTVRDHVKGKVEAYLNELFDEKDSLCAELEAAQVNYKLLQLLHRMRCTYSLCTMNQNKPVETWRQPIPS
eukprot:gene31157-40512_t